jgi:aminoglycoside 3-N-acetyltransferase
VVEAIRPIRDGQFGFDEQRIMNSHEFFVVTRSKLVKDFISIGVRPGATIVLHASVKAIGWVVGGPDVVLNALREVLGPDGTLMMMIGWEDNPYDLGTWPEERRRLYLEECPPFDPTTSRANRNWSILTEYLRTTPGARRSANPEKSMAAVGAKAEWLMADHPLDYGFGRDSPLEKLCEAGGKVLLLGTPFDSVTLLHYAECLAEVSEKRVVRYQMPILVNGLRRWVDVEEFDTCDGIRDWDGGDYFEAIIEEYRAIGHGMTGLVGTAKSYLFDAKELTAFGVAWMEREFG